MFTLPSSTNDKNLLSPIKGVKRNFTDRVLINLTEKCFHYCDFCYKRRGDPSNHNHIGDELTKKDIDAIGVWLNNNLDVKEVIVSGGDPLTQPLKIIEYLSNMLKNTSIEKWRFSTRALSFMPTAITPKLVKIMNERPCTVMAHINSTQEINAESLASVNMLQLGGINIVNQSVLLRGINDSKKQLEELFTCFTGMNIGLKYIYHPDYGYNTLHRELPIHRGLSIYNSVECPKPEYVICVPNRIGKVKVSELKNIGMDNQRCRYRWERPDGWDSFFKDEYYEWTDINDSDSYNKD